MYKIKWFSLYSDRRWNGFSKTEEFKKQLSFAIVYMYIHFFYRSIFMRTKAFTVAKKIKNKRRTRSDLLNIRAECLGWPCLK